MRRNEQLADYLRTLVAETITREVDVPDGVLVSVTHVDIARNHRHAIAWLSVLPTERGQDMIDLVSKHLYDIQGIMNKRVASHPAPRLSLKLDEGPAHLARIEELSRTIE